MNSSKTAILLGASGLCGGILLEQLIQDKNYAKIKVFARSPLAIQSDKIEMHLCDLLQLEEQEAHFTGDVVFCCIGTTKAKTKDPILYRKIDGGIPRAAANLAKNKGISSFIVISALGANPRSSIAYNQIKGKMEQDVLAENIPHTFILQPSLILGDRNEKRSLEAISMKIFRFLSFLFVGPLKKYKAIEAKTIACAMHQLADSSLESQRFSNLEIEQICFSKK